MTESTRPPDQRWSSDDPATRDPATTDPATAPPATSSAPTTSTTSTAVVETRDGRPGLVTAGAITLIVLGVLTVLFSLLAFLGGALFAGGGADGAAAPPGFEGMMGAFAGMLFFIAILVLVFGALQVWAGINALGGRSWARITGIVLAVIAAALFVGGLFTAGGEGSNPILNIVFIAAYAFVIFALASGGRWFSSRVA